MENTLLVTADSRMEMIARLKQTLHQAGNAFPGLAEAATGNPDPEAFSKASGQPPSLVALIDQALRWIWFSGPSGRADAIAFALRMLDPAPGVVLKNVPIRLLIWILHEVAKDCAAVPRGETMQLLVGDLIALQQRSLDGDPIDKKEWRQFRGRAIASTDATSDELLRNAARIVEAGAWDVATTKVVLTDVLTAFRDFRVMLAGQRSSWTQEDERRAIVVLQGIFDETKPRRDAGEVVAIPPIFREREPEMAADYEANLKAQNSAAIMAMREVISQAVFLSANVVSPHEQDVPA